MSSWRQYCGKFVAAIVVLLGILYAGDWAVFRIRLAHGTAYGSVEVDQFLASPLKGNKTEYDMVGSFQQACSRSIFPHEQKPACWWVKRHSTQWE